MKNYELELFKLRIERALKTIEGYKEQISVDVTDRVTQLFLYSILNDIICDLEYKGVKD